MNTNPSKCHWLQSVAVIETLDNTCVRQGISGAAARIFSCSLLHHTANLHATEICSQEPLSKTHRALIVMVGRGPATHDLLKRQGNRGSSVPCRQATHRSPSLVLGMVRQRRRAV